jgi:hypothetical protein
MSNSTFSPRQAAHALGIRLDSVYALLWAGKILAEKRDGRWVVSAEDVERRRRAKNWL